VLVGPSTAVTLPGFISDSTPSALNAPVLLQ